MSPPVNLKALLTPHIDVAASSPSEEPIEVQRCVTAVIIGAGHRGITYAGYALDFPEKLKIVAVADPRPFARERLKKRFHLPDDRLFNDWRDLVNLPRLADAVIITTPDRFHREPAIAMCRLGYNVLLEKPMAPVESDVRAIYNTAKEEQVLFAVCHVMRYFPPVVKIRQLLEAGAVGTVTHIRHTENIGYWHFAHSYVRGNWRKEAISSSSLLAKCCHDMDAICYWMGNKKCVKVSSFGSLHHFKKENKPVAAGNATKCYECPVESTCPYSAKRIYLDAQPTGPEWPVSIVCDIEGLSPPLYRAAVRAELETGPYGRCVYESDNDVCDNQVVNLEFEDGATATLTMVAFSQGLCTRETKICGSRGEIVWQGEDEGPIVLHDFLTGETQELFPDDVLPKGTRMIGHGGADFFVADCFVKAVATGDASYIRTGPEQSLTTHMMVFAAEESRKRNKVAFIDKQGHIQFY